MRDISLHILDLAQNSIVAGAKNIDISFEYRGVDLIITINDDGCGMSEETLKNVKSPFFTSRTTRPVGFGIPLFTQNAEASGGNLDIESKVGFGTKLTAVFKTDNIDCLPLGDICDTMLSLILCNVDIDFKFSVKREDEEAELNTAEIKSVLKDVSINEPSVLAWISDTFENEFKPLFGGY